MSWELFYTSAPRGLRTHNGGFCTVARTDAMSAAVVERLESLSSYQPIHAAGSHSAGLNPIAWSHWKIPVGSRNRSVLSRVAFVESDYTGRPGKFAYHVLLEPTEQSPIGPAGMMLAEGVMQTSWAREPMLLKKRSLTKVVAANTQIASGLQNVSARLAEAFQDDPEKPLYVTYEPGTHLLPMLNMAIGLLAPALRWQVTFSTYFSELPAGLSCAWRCVVAGTPAAALARTGTAVHIDLTSGARA